MNAKSAAQAADGAPVVVTGAGGSHRRKPLVRYFCERGHWPVRAVDHKPLPQVVSSAQPESSRCCAWTRSQPENCRRVCEGAAEVYNLAADMGGMGFIEHFRVECLPFQSIVINTHMLEAAYRADVWSAVLLRVVRVRLQHRTPKGSRGPGAQGVRTPTPRCRTRADTGWEKLLSEMFCQEYWAERGLQNVHWTAAVPQRVRARPEPGTGDGRRHQRRFAGR